MIRAIFRDGTIQPLDPLPSGWSEGQELQIIEGEPSDDPEAIERWYRELTELANQPHDPEDWGKLQSALAEADRLAKDQVRSESGSIRIRPNRPAAVFPRWRRAFFLGLIES